MMNGPAEDKTCRLCGYADQSNLNIYTTRDVYKIVLALYPIILYQSDPLPKNICLKCFGNALTKYDEYQRIEKIQNKWINNVRNNQPSNPYIRMLDLIEAANQHITQELKNLAPDFYSKSFQLIKFNRDFPININVSTSRQNSTQISSTNNKNNQNLTFPTTSIDTKTALVCPNNSHPTILKKHQNIIKKETSLVPAKPFESILKQHLQQEKQYSKSQNEQKTEHLERLQSILASNGCTLMTVNDKNKLKYSTKNYPRNHCRYCLKIFPNQKLLSLHQAKKHLKINLYKIYEKKPLYKKLRRAIEIMVHNKNWFRCQNCWNIYGNHESILNHWKMKRCDFFCKICGKEYPTDPKLLRQHITEKHEIPFIVYKNIKKNVTELKSLKNDTFKNSIENNIEDGGKLKKTDESIKIKNEFINQTEERIPILKLTRKSNSAKEEFDVKFKNNDSKKLPLLRVKDISELQDDSNNQHEDNYLNFSNLDFESASNRIKRDIDEL